MIRVELDLAVVEVQVRSVREVAIGAGIIAFAHPGHRTSRFTLGLDPRYVLLVLNFIRQHSDEHRRPAPGKDKQQSPQHNTLSEAVTAETLVARSLCEERVGDGNPWTAVHEPDSGKVYK